MMIRALILSLLAVAFTAISCNPSTSSSGNGISIEEQQSLPNIVLLIGDDQGYPYFGFMGANYIHTPNMDKLAASGTLFTQGYVPENHCRPSLQSLMTGTLPIDYAAEVELLLEKEMAIEDKTDPIDFRHHAMKHFATLPKLLAEKGYSSFQGGKWWEFNYQNGGFSHGMTNGWTAEERKDGGKWFKRFMGGDGLKLARATMQPAYDFIEANGSQPFFMWYAPELPHYPFNAPDHYYELYADSNMTESAKRYYANCTWFDDGVGELMAFLKEMGKHENTLYIYVNDNGWEQNPDQEFRHDSLRWHNGGDKGKSAVFDQSFRTPIIFSWEGKFPAGERRNELIHSADIPATILDLLGLERPASYFGYSYLPLIDPKTIDSNFTARTEILGNSDVMRDTSDMMGKPIEAYWMRNEEYFFKWNLTTEAIGLYAMKNDPFSHHNLADSMPERVVSYKARLIEWKRSKGR